MPTPVSVAAWPALPWDRAEYRAPHTTDAPGPGPWPAAPACPAASSQGATALSQISLAAAANVPPPGPTNVPGLDIIIHSALEKALKPLNERLGTLSESVSQRWDEREDFAGEEAEDGVADACAEDQLRRSSRIASNSRKT